MSVRIRTAALSGLEAAPVEVEASVSPGLPNFIIVGLPDAAVQEARERVRSAIRHAGFSFPNQRITVNLAPADFRKAGPAYDLPISLAVLCASRSLAVPSLDQCFVGELSLEGALRPIRGALPIAEFARDNGVRDLFLPVENIREASFIVGPALFPVSDLGRLVRHLTGHSQIKKSSERLTLSDFSDGVLDSPVNLENIRGQSFGKRAIEIAAAGGHNLLMTGPPGSGKTLLAKALRSILPPLAEREALEVTKIYSVAGLLDEKTPLVATRPFRSPHHSASAAAIVGGGRVPHPGEISLAHRGVLFLDELPEFPRIVLEALRQPLEEGVVTVARVAGSIRYPARLLLIAARNPCPCGFAGDHERACVCSSTGRLRYQHRISGPLVDRFDLLVTIPRLPVVDLIKSGVDGESTATVRERVVAARLRQRERWSDTGALTNAELPNAALERVTQLEVESVDLLRAAVDQLKLTARAYHRTLRVARTIADLAGSQRVATTHVAEALQYRASEV